MANKYMSMNAGENEVIFSFLDDAEKRQTPRTTADEIDQNRIEGTYSSTVMIQKNSI
jgi:hypothetical protein